MALGVGRKKPPDGGGDSGEPDFTPQPEKARQWFNHARTAAEGAQLEYAMHCYANGIRLNPGEMAAHDQMYQAALRYAKQGGKPAKGGEVRKLEGTHPVDKLAAAEFAWMMDFTSASQALRFLEAAVKAQAWAGDVARALSGRVLGVLRGQKKPSKSTFLAAKDLFAQLGAWDEAVAAGQGALQLDPTDAALSGEIQDLTVQRTIDRAGYAEAGGQEGGYRKLVKDIDKQRELEARESIAGGESIDELNMRRAKQEYEKSPDVPDVINQYMQLLKARGTPESEEQAHELALKGHQKTGQYRFRAFAGDIRMEQAQRKVTALEEQITADGADAGLERELDAARAALLDLRLAEYTQRVKEYPTDRRFKHLLGMVKFDRGDFQGAIQCFQEAKEEPSLRVAGGLMAGRSFAALGWHPEAIEEYREALPKLDGGEKDTELAIRYDLMVSLMAEAKEQRSLELAKEALAICSIIARKSITYRDIREFRSQVDTLIRSLSGGSGSGGSGGRGG